jgi:hypothetical protein
MSGIARRLTKLEAASGHTAQTVVVFVSFMPGPDLHDTATVDGRVWHREPDELEKAFHSRVAAEARLARQGSLVLVAFLRPPCGRYDSGTESRGEAAGRTELTSQPFHH